MKSTLLNYSVVFFSPNQIKDAGLWVDAIVFISQSKASSFFIIFSHRTSLLKRLQIEVGSFYSKSKVQLKQFFSCLSKSNLSPTNFLKSSAFYSPSIELRILIIEQIKINSYGPESLPKSI